MADRPVKVKTANGKVIWKKKRSTADKVDRNFPCPFPHCYKAYGANSSLKKHISVKHAQDTPPMSAKATHTSARLRDLPRVTSTSSHGSNSSSRSPSVSGSSKRSSYPDTPMSTLSSNESFSNSPVSSNSSVASSTTSGRTSGSSLNGSASNSFNSRQQFATPPDMSTSTDYSDLMLQTLQSIPVRLPSTEASTKLTQDMFIPVEPYSYMGSMLSTAESQLLSNALGTPSPMGLFPFLNSQPQMASFMQLQALQQYLVQNEIRSIVNTLGTGPETPDGNSDEQSGSASDTKEEISSNASQQSTGEVPPSLDNMHLLEAIARQMQQTVDMNTDSVSDRTSSTESTVTSKSHSSKKSAFSSSSGSGSIRNNTTDSTSKNGKRNINQVYKDTEEDSSSYEYADGENTGHETDRLSKEQLKEHDDEDEEKESGRHKKDSTTTVAGSRTRRKKRRIAEG